MATTSGSGSAQKHSTSSSSRFASLKVFKFAASSSKHSPPVPPPKENPPTNNSLVSLTSLSSTAVSAEYARSQSTSPCPPANSPALSSQDSTLASSSTSFGKSLIKLAKRTLTPKSSTRQLSEFSEDSSISLPWNFQHNLHVDEGYHGLPPSWVASLAGVGYSEEEIETINHRRATSRAPSTVPFQHPNFPNLPSTSQLSTATQNTRGRATPSSSIRTPSIHRQPSQASVQSRGTRRTREVSTDTARSRQSFYQTSSGSNSFGDLSYAADDNLPPLPNNPSTHFNDTTHKPKKSIDTLTSGFMNLNGQIPSPITRSKSSHDLPLVPSQSQSQLASRPSQSRTPSRDGVSQVGKIAGPTGPSAYHPPRTPPKSVNQMFRVVNEPFLQSPPPAYHLDGPPPIGTVEKPPLSSSQPQQPRQRAPQPQLRKMPSTRQRQVDEEPRISVLSTSTITPRSGSEDHSTDQRDASEPEVNSACFDNGETDGVGFSPISLPPLELSMSSLPMPPPVPAKKKRYSLAPPRLSLGEDTFVNIGSWGDSLFDSLSATPTTAADSSLDASPSNGLIKKSAAVTGGTGVEKRKLEASLSAGATGSNFASTSLAIKEKEKEKDKKESSGPHGLTTPSSLLVSPPLATSLSLPNQTIHQRSQSSLSQCQVQSQSQVQSQAQTRSQLQLAPTPPPKTAPVIPIPQPPALSTSTSSSSSTSTSGSDSQPKTRMLPSTTTTRVPDRFTPSPAPSLARGRTEYDPPKSGDSPLPKTTTSTNLPPIPQPQPPWERPSSRASAVHRPLPPQKPLPTLSLMSPIPLPNPPSHVELKSKISTVSLKTAAKREREKEAEKVEKVESFEKQEQEALKKVENAKAKEEAKERWPMTATETIEFMASINHDNDGLDFGKKKGQDTSALPDLNKKMSSVSLDTCQSYDVRDSHLSVDSTKFDPDRLSSTSTGSRGSTRSSSGLKLIIEGGDYHNDNRDSNISTSTITNATIVSGPVEVATRARADLVTSPATPNPQVGLGLSGSTSSPSPANLGALSPGEPPLEAGAGSRETTPKQTTPSVSNVDVVTDDESSRVGLEGRSSSPGSSTHSHSSSSATTLSSTGLSSLGSANKTVGFTRPVIKQGSGWESEEGVGKVVASNSSSSLASPYKSEFDDESGGGGGDDGDGDDDGDEIEVGDEEEDAVITRISPPSPGSQEGFAAGLMDEITDHRRPSLDMPSLSSYSSVAPGPHTAAAAISQMPSPFNSVPHSAGSGGSPPVQSPSWVSDALSEAGLETFVDEKVEPRDYFEELTEVAEGESGFVYRARVVQTVPGSKLTERGPQPGTLVAIKAIPILSSGSSKLQDLKREVEVMKRVFEDDRSAASLKFPSVGASHALIMEAMYVDLQEDALWIRMELMERSLADVVALVEEGHLERIDEKVAARFASDMAHALSYLHGLGIAHRDVRSDNLLLNRDGVLKIADFSNAVTVTPRSPTCTGVVGVSYWQAPEVRAGTYNPMKADIWSLGATIWEMAESIPPFHGAANESDLGDRWPPLTMAQEFSRSLHDFLTLCSNPATSRPDANVLVQTPFVRSAARRSAVIRILKKCQNIERSLMSGRPSVDSQVAFSR